MPTAFKHAQLAEALQKRIESGEFPEGSFLPTYKELELEYGVTPNTITKALNSLKRFVQRRQGARSYVKILHVKSGDRAPIKSVGLILSDPLQGNSVHAFVQAFLEEAGDLGWNPILHFTYAKPEREAAIITRLQEEVDALVIFPADIKANYDVFMDFYRTRKPLVFIDRLPIDMPAELLVQFNEYEAGRRAAECLVGQCTADTPCRAIFYVTNSPRAVNHERAKGVAFVCHSQKKPMSIKYKMVMIQDPEPRLTGRDLADKVMDLYKDKTYSGILPEQVGIVAAYDDIAEGVLETLFVNLAGFRLISFDNSAMARDLRIASVQRDPGKLAKAAVHKIMYNKSFVVDEPKIILKNRLTHQKGWVYTLQPYWKTPLESSPKPPSTVIVTEEAFPEELKPEQ